MAKEAVTLEIEAGAILQAQRIACDLNVTVKRWMEEVANQANTNGSPDPQSRGTVPVRTRRPH
jgi:hypothetical protein